MAASADRNEAQVPRAGVTTRRARGGSSRYADGGRIAARGSRIGSRSRMASSTESGMCDG